MFRSLFAKYNIQIQLDFPIIKRSSNLPLIISHNILVARIIANQLLQCFFLCLIYKTKKNTWKLTPFFKQINQSINELQMFLERLIRS